jgi:glutamine---fructose-6-phosphate transaminase (isomerizing)
MRAPTHFQQDILRQPAELRRTVEILSGTGKVALQRASALVRNARHVFLTGIGASWNACLGAEVLYGQRGRPVFAVEAAELLHFTEIPPASVVIAISRTGRSIEIVQLLAKIRQSGASLIGITNCADSPLATEASVAIAIPATLDYAISVNTYSTLALAAGALACTGDDDFQEKCASFLRSLSLVDERLKDWRESLSRSAWLKAGATYCFLARGPSLATCHESRLLWEEGAKWPATAMTTSGFRHGPQEIVVPGMRFCLWLDAKLMRDQDLAVAADLRQMGADVALIGQDLKQDAAGLVFELPRVTPAWQFVLDIIPMQLAAEALASLSGVDCDSFRVCSYIVEDEHGLLKKHGEGGAQ